MRKSVFIPLVCGAFLLAANAAAAASDPPRLLNETEFFTAVHSAYPEALRPQGIRGEATISFVVNAEGRATDVRVEGASHEAFGVALAGLIQTARFEGPSSERSRLTIAFRPDRAPRRAPGTGQILVREGESGVPTVVQPGVNTIPLSDGSRGIVQVRRP